MFFEKPPIGFRLKVAFQSNLQKEDAYVFVDVSKTPTIGTLLKDINKRFELNHDHLGITVLGVKVLLSENVIVLADIDKAEVFTAPSNTVVSNSTSPRKLKHSPTSPSNCTSLLKNEENSYSLGQAIVTESSKPTKSTKEKLYPHKGLASFLSQLREEDKKHPAVEDVSSYSQGMGYKKKNKYDDTHAEDKSNKNAPVNAGKEDEASMECGDGDLNCQNISDSNEYGYEKKKRKRKRKHSKKRLEAEDGVDELDVHVEKKAASSTNSTRQHIYFNDTDEIDGPESTEEKNMGMNTVQETTFKAIEVYNRPPPSQFSHAQNKSPSVETSRSPRTNIQSNNFNKREIQLGADMRLKPKHVPKNNEHERLLSTLLMLKELKTSSEYNVQFQNDSQLLTSAERVNNSFPKMCGSKSLASSPSSYSISNYGESARLGYPCKSWLTQPLPKKTDNILEQICTWEPDNWGLGKKADEIVASSSVENAPKLQRKELPENYIKNTPSNAAVDQDIQTISVSSSSIGSASLPQLQRRNSVDNRNADEEIQTISCGSSISVGGNESDECELVLQFRIDGDKIRLRNKYDHWRILTPEIAEDELPCVVTPKENQSLVFRILYLKHNTWPTISDIIYGRVLRCKLDQQKIALEIPHKFIEKIINESCLPEESSLPEGMVFITGSVYELDWLAVRDPRLLS